MRPLDCFDSRTQCRRTLQEGSAPAAHAAPGFFARLATWPSICTLPQEAYTTNMDMRSNHVENQVLIYNSAPAARAASVFLPS